MFFLRWNMKRLNSKGLGLPEMCIGMLFLSLIVQSIVLSLLVLTKKAVVLEERGYASIKAQQMYNELSACANSSPVFSEEILDGTSDGSGYNLVLTTDKLVHDPEDPLSGNRKANGHWKYLRQIQVGPVDGNPQARQVTVKVWRCQSDGNPLVPGLMLNTALGTVIPGARPTYVQTPRVYLMPLGHY
jgi:hypothetical protein